MQKRIKRTPGWLAGAGAVLGLITASLVPATTSTAAPPEQSDGVQFRVLVFTRATGATHASTSAGVSAIRALGEQLRFAVQVTDDSRRFTESHLKQYRAVVFLNTTGDVLNAAQQAAFEQYFFDGGGFVGVHAAIEAEPEWQFLTDVIGTRANGASPVSEATVKVADRVHGASADLPEYWERTDQWYNFAANVRGQQHVLATVDESTYAGGTMGPDHPITWCQDYKGGRSFYTAGGDTPATFSEPEFRSHLGGAIRWAAGVGDGDCGATVVANYQQTPITTQPNLNEPIGFDVLPDGRVVQTDRRGGVRLHDPVANSTTILANIPVYTNSEDGLYGPAIDKDFATNKWVYLYYAPLEMDPPYPPSTPAGNAPTTGVDPSVWDPWLGYFQLSRFKFVDATSTEPAHLDLASEQEILKVEVNRGACCHVAGDISFDSENNLWLVTGDDTPAGGGNSGGFGPFNDMRTNESQTVAVANATGGTFTLTFDGQTTGPIAFPLDNTEIEAALEALSNIDDVAVTGTGTRTVNFRGSLSQTDVPQMTADASGLTSTATATVTVNTTVQGALYNTPHVDARRSSLSTNDLRGKILRITVQDDGSYTVPAGNLFAPGTEDTRPEIYAMGLRNPFRINLDAEDNAYITDYSPDSQTPSVFRGPPGTGRVMVVREPANYGWPVCYSPELPYYKWDFNTTTNLDPGNPEQFDCDDPAKGPDNESRWNTGLVETPPIAESEMWYSYQDNNPNNPLGTPCPANYTQNPPGTCPQLFPELGTGGVGPHGAAPYDFDPDNDNPTKFPEYWDGAFVFGEFTRDFLREIRLDEDGNVFKINNTLPCGAVGSTQPFQCDNPMDITFAPDGTLYLLTYGDGFFNINPDAGMYRFEYVKGTRAPIAVLSASVTSGPVPLTVQFSSEGTRDPDPGDSISYEWDFDGNGTVDSIDPNPSFTYTTPGQFTARLTVTDSSGMTGVANTVITAGNTAPEITVTVPANGGTFAFGETVPFTVTGSDAEDGPIDCSRLEVTWVLGHDTHGHAGETVTGCTG
ncbi:MAG TPA: ThuA domain-containing protein, partial [Jiangellales bacterium]|nr:ThuA domain-containing protein [Jiangellales bacterium]